MFDGFELGGLAFVAALLHPDGEPRAKFVHRFGVLFVAGEVVEFERVGDDVVELFLGAQLVTFDESFGFRGVDGEPALEFRRVGAGVFEFGFRSKVPDEFKFLRADRTNAIVRRAGIDALGGHDAVDVCFVSFFSSEDRKEALSLKERIGSASGRFDPGGKEVDVFDHGGIGGAGFDLTRPAGDEAGLEAAVVTGPLREGHGAALFAGDDEESVVGEFVFFEKLHRILLQVRLNKMRPQILQSLILLNIFAFVFHFHTILFRSKPMSCLPKQLQKQRRLFWRVLP